MHSISGASGNTNERFSVDSIFIGRNLLCVIEGYCALARVKMFTLSRSLSEKRQNKEYTYLVSKAFVIHSIHSTHVSYSYIDMN